MNCYKCGAVVADGTKFCTNCGADLIIDTTGKTYASFGGGGEKLFEEEQKAEEANNQNDSQGTNQNYYQNASQGANQNYNQNTSQGYNQNTNQGYQTYNGRQEPYLAGNDKTMIALLCFFLGGLGVHCFVMGETRKGIIRIVFSLLCGIGGIFALIDFIMILSDTYVVNPDAYFFK